MRTALLTIFALCLSWHLFADEAEAKATAIVVDEKGNPISDVKIIFGYEHLITFNPWDGRTTSKIEGITESGGIFTGSSSGLPRIAITATKDGYYKSYKEYEFKNSKGGKWQPWNPTFNIVLRKIVAPVPMYVKDFKIYSLKLPVKNRPAGYDLIAGDWVNPYGSGKTNDISFTIAVERQGNLTFKYKLEIKMNREGDGFSPIPKEVFIAESALKLPYKAPETGYSDAIIIQRDVTEGKVTSVVEPDTSNYFIRIRTVFDENGKAKQAIYGKIVGPVECLPFLGDNGAASFTYYLNPDYTQNTEWNSEKNLFIPDGANKYIEKYRDCP